MIKPTVLLLCGMPGTGKSLLLQQFAGATQLLMPPRWGEPLSPKMADWCAYSEVAIDEVFLWERSSVAQAVADLEQSALERGKTLILVVQCRTDLVKAGIQLATEPMIIELFGRQDAISISYAQRTVRFQRPTTA